jgi:hypothetical protein
MRWIASSSRPSAPAVPANPADGFISGACRQERSSRPAQVNLAESQVALFRDAMDCFCSDTLRNSKEPCRKVDPVGLAQHRTGTPDLSPNPARIGLIVRIGTGRAELKRRNATGPVDGVGPRNPAGVLRCPVWVAGIAARRASPRRRRYGHGTRRGQRQNAARPQPPGATETYVDFALRLPAIPPIGGSPSLG